MKKCLIVLLACLAPSLFAAEYLHIRNQRSSVVSYAIEGVAGIRRVVLQSNESISFRFTSENQKIKLVTPSGTTSGNGKVFIVESNESPESGSIVQGDFSSYPILLRVVDVVSTPSTVVVKEHR